MKTLFSALALTFAFGAVANNALCTRSKLSFNSHAALNRPCPNVEAFCLTAVDGGDLQLQVDGQRQILRSEGGTNQENMSDVQSRLYQTFDLNGMYVDVTIASDGEYPHPVRRAGFGGLMIATGLQERSGVYSSQVCVYETP